jgi:hypothetical protein
MFMANFKNTLVATKTNLTKKLKHEYLSLAQGANACVTAGYL